MANLKAIRRRIKSVQSTQKITRAMRMVAAAKVRRAQFRTLAARPFTRRVVELLREIIREVPACDLNEIPLLKKREIKSVALIVITADRGLCGSYNSNVLRNALTRIQALEAEGKKVKIIRVGMKAAAFFRCQKVEKLGNAYTLLPAVPTVQEAKLIAERAVEQYLLGTVDAIEIITTRFINMLRSELVNFKFLPVDVPALDPPLRLTPPTLFEPSMSKVLELEILPKYLENVVFQGLLEASASEQAARMTAMTNATKNAEELIQNLTLNYNRVRQASITQELLEVVAGAEALKG
jgi:F-type H+-transporting ATPase subunit gamma